MKWLIRIVIVFVLLLLIGVVGVYLSLDGIVKSVVEKQGTQQLKVATTVGGVSLGLFNGTVGMNTLAIASPSGFTAPQMFSVGSLSIDSGGITHLRNQPIHLTSINIDSPQLIIEQHGSKLNFRELMNNLPSHPDKGSDPSTSSSSATKLIVDTLTLSNASVQFQSDLPGLNKPYDIKLPKITMQKIGNADGNQSGVAIKDLATTVITQMIQQATKTGGFPIDVQGLLSGNLDQVQDKLTGEAQKQLEALKIPANVSGLLNQVTGNKSQDPNGAAGGAAQDLIGKGFGLVKEATSKPSH